MRKWISSKNTSKTKTRKFNPRKKWGKWSYFEWYSRWESAKDEWTQWLNIDTAPIKLENFKSDI